MVTCRRHPIGSRPDRCSPANSRLRAPHPHGVTDTRSVVAVIRMRASVLISQRCSLGPRQHASYTLAMGRVAGRAFAAALLVAALSVGAAARGAEALTSCPSGKTRIRIGKKTSCVASAGVLPAAPASLTSGTFLVRQALGGKVQAPSVRALPSGKLSRDPLADAAITPDLAVFSAHVDPFGAKSKAYPQGSSGASAAYAAPGPARRADTPAGGGITYTENGVTAVQSGSAISVHGSADLGDRNGYTGTLEMHGNIPLDKNGKPLDSAAALEFGVELSKGNVKAGVSFRLGMNDGLKFDAPCPSAAGDVEAKEKLAVNVTSHGEHTDGLDYVRSHTTLNDSSAWHGTVDTDAKLQRVEFTDTLVVDFGRSAAVGPIQVQQSSVTTVTAAGTIDGQSGRVSLTSFTVDGHADASGIGSSAFEANFASSVRSESSLAEWKKLMSESAHFKWERFKAAETEWQTENECAKIVFDPVDDPQLAPGAKRQLSGKVLSKDGQPSDSKWQTPTFDVGSLASGLPGSTGAANPIKFGVVGGGPSGTTTVQLNERATSRAGVAAAPWHASFGGWKVVLSGDVSAQQSVMATVTSSPSATAQVTYQTVGGVSGYHGTAPIAYTTPSVTPVPGSPCNYSLTGITGTMDANIRPSADGSQISVQLFLHDVVDATITCGGIPGPLGSPLVGTVNFPSPNPTLAFPAATPGDQPLNWSISTPFPATGRLNIHVEPLTG
jgi:hypothetical protein